MSMFTLRRSQKQSGFTLMELLIVIAVLGLLLGMLIPRLAGVTDDTVDTVCDSNNKGIRYFTQIYYNTNNSLPDGLTNLVDLENTTQTFTADYSLGNGIYVTGERSANYMPSYEDDGDTDAEALAAEFYTRNWPGGYALDSKEVAELKAMGITTVYNYIGSAGRSMDKQTLQGMLDGEVTTEGSEAAGAIVMMMGAQAATSTAAPSMIFNATTHVGNPYWIGRIMMAVNDKCDLVKSGMIQASALCPGAVLAEEDFTIKEYVIVLPRLEQTVTRFASLISDGADIRFISEGYDSVATGTLYDFTFEAQSPWEFDMSCPEGHKWPDNDDEYWVYYDGGITGWTTPTDS